MANVIKYNTLTWVGHDDRMYTDKEGTTEYIQIKGCP